jgi:predicted transposase YbfD/YdcC
MTKEEHALMIGVFAAQLEVIQALAQILESHNLITADDLHAFLAIRTPSERSEMHEKARLIYASLAAKAGIDIGQAG